VIQPFYAMSGKGFDISAIAAEINQKLYQVLPRSHFVAAIFASLDPVQKTVEVWCGGCPPPLLLSPEGKVVHRFRSRHVALSILAPAGFDGAVERFSFGDRDLSLFMFSDGVLEAENQYGEHFGLERLLGALASEAHSARLKNVPEVLEAHCRESNAEHDDITFIMARCQCGGEAAAQKPESGLAKD
jgi:serine phosphatase RsbU (regulator of sigma subunit)